MAVRANKLIILGEEMLIAVLHDNYSRDGRHKASIRTTVTSTMPLQLAPKPRD